MSTLVQNRLRTVRSLALQSVLAVIIMVLIGIAAVVFVLLVKPTDTVSVLKVQLGVGASSPGLSLCGPGRVINYGTPNNIRAVHVCGPVRPIIETHATAAEIAASAKEPEAKDKAGRAITTAFWHWAISRSFFVAGVGFGLAICFWRLLPHFWRQQFSRTWRTIIASSFIVILATTWGLSLYLAYAGSQDLRHIHSVSDIFDYTKLRTAPEPAGPRVTGFQGAVIGDSRASLWGGQPMLSPTADDRDCNRSRDSLAVQLEQLVGDPGWRAVNLACPSATIAAGLLGPQDRSGRELSPQVGLLKQLAGLKQVVVMIGPNDVNWSFLVGTCMVVGCDYPVTGNALSSALASFRTPYADLLGELRDLPTHPAVTIVGAYGLYGADASCGETKSYFGSHFLTTGELTLIEESRAQLNELLQSGAEKMRFGYVTPHLEPLCAPDSTGLGPQIQGMQSEFRFHPTPSGELMLAAQIFRVMRLSEPSSPNEAEARHVTDGNIAAPPGIANPSP